MLKRLRNRMAMLNAAISGAILLVMALAALHVSEGMIASQYERDLQQNASAMLAAMQSANANVNIQFASGYSVYVQNGEQAQIISTASTGSEPLVAAVDKARGLLEENMGRQQEAATPRLVQKFFVSTVQYGEEEGRDNLVLFRQQAMYTLPNLLIEVGHKAYRVSATVAGGEHAQQVFVLQDRTAELAAVENLRWLFFGCALGGLALTALASLFLSTRAIRPVEQSLAQQCAFVAAASHELRTPVAAVRANAEVLADAPLGEFSPYLDAIAQESARMSHLVSDLMDLARADAGELQVLEETIDAADIARRAAALLTPMATQKNQTLALALESALCRADGDRLCQALVILLDNAIRYTQEGGEIRLSVAKEDQQVCVRVADNGPGIPNEEKERVFERFVRLDAARPSDGCGLGLSVARQLAGQMHGTLTLADAPEGGSVFQVCLKAAK